MVASRSIWRHSTNVQENMYISKMSYAKNLGKILLEHFIDTQLLITNVCVCVFVWKDLNESQKLKAMDYYVYSIPELVWEFLLVNVELEYRKNS